MKFSEKMPLFFFLSVAFFFGLICIGNPFLVARLIALLLWPVLKFTSIPEIDEILDLINEPDVYVENFSGQIQTIHRIGYVGIFAALTGICMIFMYGLV